MQFLKIIKHRVEYAVFLLIAFIFRALPLETASAFSGWGWRLVAPLTRRHSRAIANLSLAFPDKSEAQCDAIAREMWRNLGCTFGEFFHLDEIHDSERINAQALAGAADFFNGGKSAVVCAAHQGNWEIAVMAPVRLGARPASIYQRLSNPLVDQKTRHIRQRFYPGGLLEKSAASGAHALRYVRQGGSLAVLADVRDNSGPKVDFFARPAPSTPYPAKVARMLDVPLIAFFITREPGVKFKVSYEVIEVPRTHSRDADARAATQNLQAAFERSIRARPEQWMWAHRRWG